MDIRKCGWTTRDNMKLSRILEFLDHNKIEDVLYTIKQLYEEQKADKIEKAQKQLEEAQKELEKLNNKIT